jgi:hypothetical protein
MFERNDGKLTRIVPVPPAVAGAGARELGELCHLG